MRKIIDNKIYDTEKADLITGICREGVYITDFSYWSKEIYKTKKGEYFLFSVMRGEKDEIETIQEHEVLQLLIYWQKIDLIETLFPGTLTEA